MFWMQLGQQCSLLGYLGIAVSYTLESLSSREHFLMLKVPYGASKQLFVPPILS